MGLFHASAFLLLYVVLDRLFFPCPSPLHFFWKMEVDSEVPETVAAAADVMDTSEEPSTAPAAAAAAVPDAAAAAAAEQEAQRLQRERVKQEQEAKRKANAEYEPSA